jgi:putative ABC transport system ATP-binding protein
MIDATEGERLSGSVLELIDVVREYRRGSETVRGLDGVSLAVAAGEMIAITGRSGSGKSTLINVAGGLDVPTAGEVRIDGRPLHAYSISERAKVRRQVVGYVFQSLNLIDDLTATENVALPRELDGVRPQSAHKAAVEALERVGIADLADRFPDELSGGQQQRVAIARALVGSRKLILADEPTGALDDLTARGVYALLAQLAEEGAAVVVVTHDHELAAHAHRVIRLADGAVASATERVQAPASPAELLR